MARTRTVLGAVVASTVFVGFEEASASSSQRVGSRLVGFGGGVPFPILPNLGTAIGISPFVVGQILSAIASDGVPASRDRSLLVVAPHERTILFCRPV